MIKSLTVRLLCPKRRTRNQIMTPITTKRVPQGRKFLTVSRTQRLQTMTLGLLRPRLSSRVRQLGNTGHQTPRIEAESVNMRVAWSFRKINTTTTRVQWDNLSIFTSMDLSTTLSSIMVFQGRGSQPIIMPLPPDKHIISKSMLKEVR